tara:strand:- start:106 stop:213 length:108 start_codon:yes stop_codon:yes gene_type:complete
MYAVVEPLVGIVGKPSIEGDYMVGWKRRLQSDLQH